MQPIMTAEEEAALLRVIDDIWDDIGFDVMDIPHNDNITAIETILDCERPETLLDDVGDPRRDRATPATRSGLEKLRALTWTEQVRWVAARRTFV